MSYAKRMQKKLKEVQSWRLHRQPALAILGARAHRLSIKLYALHVGLRNFVSFPTGLLRTI